MAERLNSPLDTEPAETAILEIWLKHLETREANLNSRFEELGGHSLHAVRIVSEIADRFGLDREMQERLLEFDTVEAQAEFLRAAGFEPSR